MGLQRFKPPRPADIRYSTTPPVPVEEMWFKQYSVDGLEVSQDMAVDGSTPVSFRVAVPVGKLGIVTRVIFHIVDNGITWTQFGGISALSNGLLVRAMDSDDSVLFDFLDGAAITSNRLFAHLASIDTSLLRVTGDDVISVRWSLFKTGYVPYLTAGQYMEILVRDNLTAINNFTCVLQGRLVDAP